MSDCLEGCEFTPDSTGRSIDAWLDGSCQGVIVCTSYMPETGDKEVAAAVFARLVSPLRAAPVFHPNLPELVRKMRSILRHKAISPPMNPGVQEALERECDLVLATIGEQSAEAENARLTSSAADKARVAELEGEVERLKAAVRGRDAALDLANRDLADLAHRVTDLRQRLERGGEKIVPQAVDVRMREGVLYVLPLHGMAIGPLTGKGDELGFDIEYPNGDQNQGYRVCGPHAPEERRRLCAAFGVQGEQRQQQGADAT